MATPKPVKKFTSKGAIPSNPAGTYGIKSYGVGMAKGGKVGGGLTAGRAGSMAQSVGKSKFPKGTLDNKPGMPFKKGGRAC